MNDPYAILGASPSDSDEVLKKKYRDLVKKYHPDNYVNNPLADLAQEKMKEINQAYDELQRQRQSGGTSGGGYGTGTSTRYGAGGYGAGNAGTGYSTSSGSTEFAGVRSAINSGDLAYAERVLRSAQNRNAEWNFLMGSVCYRKGWVDEAQKYYRQAVNMEPTNEEYRRALNYMQTSGNSYRPAGFGSGEGMDACDACAAMMCLNMLCRCH